MKLLINKLVLTQIYQLFNSETVIDVKVCVYSPSSASPFAFFRLPRLFSFSLLCGLSCVCMRWCLRRLPRELQA